MLSSPSPLGYAEHVVAVPQRFFIVFITFFFIRRDLVILRKVISSVFGLLSDVLY